MLTIDVVMSESFDDSTQEFIQETYRLNLEHSLVSLSKWESEFEKPFLDGKEKTDAETLGYIRCMVLNPEFSPEVLSRLSQQNVDAINEYINAKMTATWFNENQPQAKGPAKEIITAEIIYYWLVAMTIPFETQHWHLNRLLALVKVCNIKNSPKKKMGKREQANQQRALNAQRRTQLGSLG